MAEPSYEKEVIHNYVWDILTRSLLAGSALGLTTGLIRAALRKSRLRSPDESVKSAPLVISVEKESEEKTAKQSWDIMDIISQRQFLFPTAVATTLAGGLTTWYLTERLLREMSIAEKEKELKEIQKKYKDVIGDVKVQKTIEKVSSTLKKEADAWSLNPLNTAAYLTLLGLWAAKKFNEGVKYEKSKDPDEILATQEEALNVINNQAPPIIVIKRKVFKKAPDENKKEQK